MKGGGCPSQNWISFAEIALFTYLLFAHTSKKSSQTQRKWVKTENQHRRVLHVKGLVLQLFQVCCNFFWSYFRVFFSRVISQNGLKLKFSGPGLQTSAAAATANLVVFWVNQVINTQLLVSPHRTLTGRLNFRLRKISGTPPKKAKHRFSTDFPATLCNLSLLYHTKLPTFS